MTLFSTTRHSLSELLLNTTYCSLFKKKGVASVQQDVVPVLKQDIALAQQQHVASAQHKDIASVPKQSGPLAHTQNIVLAGLTDTVLVQ